MDMTQKIKNNFDITKNSEKIENFKIEFCNNLGSLEAEIKLQIFEGQESLKNLEIQKNILENDALQQTEKIQYRESQEILPELINQNDVTNKQYQFDNMASFSMEASQLGRISRQQKDTELFNTNSNILNSKIVYRESDALPDPNLYQSNTSNLDLAHYQKSRGSSCLDEFQIKQFRHQYDETMKKQILNDKQILQQTELITQYNQYVDIIQKIQTDLIVQLNFMSQARTKNSSMTGASFTLPKSQQVNHRSTATVGFDKSIINNNLSNQRLKTEIYNPNQDSLNFSQINYQEKEQETEKQEIQQEFLSQQQQFNNELVQKESLSMQPNNLSDIEQEKKTKKKKKKNQSNNNNNNNNGDKQKKCCCCCF